MIAEPTPAALPIVHQLAPAAEAGAVVAGEGAQAAREGGPLDPSVQVAPAEGLEGRQLAVAELEHD